MNETTDIHESDLHHHHPMMSPPKTPTSDNKIEDVSELKITKSKLLDSRSKLLINRSIIQPPQLLTITDVFDPDDSLTVHYTTSNWLNERQDASRKNLSIMSLNRINSNENIKESIYSLSCNQKMLCYKSQDSNIQTKRIISKLNNISSQVSSNNLLKSNHNLLQFNIRDRPLAVNSINSSLIKNTNLASYFDQNSYKHTDLTINKNHMADAKFAEYKRRWNEILARAKIIHEAKWASEPSRSAKLEDFELKKTLGTGRYYFN